MKKNKKIKILIIGSGNIAWHIVSHLSFFRRFDITVYNRTKNKRHKQIEKEFKIKGINDWKLIENDFKLIFICTGDSSIKSIAAKIKKIKTKAMLVHTSGTSPLSDLNSASQNTGVFYPLQTFTFGKSVNWQEVPVFIEGNNKAAEIFLSSFGKLFSDTVVKLNSVNRLKLHLAAVIAGNFSNAMFAAAHDFLQSELNVGYYKYLAPLISNTSRKAIFNNPANVQTGPAARGDKKTINKHIGLLKKNSELKKLYRNISKLIIKQQKKHAKL